MGPGCRKSGSANGSPSGILRSVLIGTDGWSVMTVGIINTSISLSNPDVTDESFSAELGSEAYSYFGWPHEFSGRHFCICLSKL